MFVYVQVAHDLAIRNQDAIDRGDGDAVKSPTLPSAWNVVDFAQAQTKKTEMLALTPKGRAVKRLLQHVVTDCIENCVGHSAWAF